jgi:thiamine-monophosphate kinase
MAERWRERARGLGDDCAFVEAGGERLAISVDLSIEGVHFRREWLTPGEIGYRAAAAALSDLAAVAAEPLALLWSLGVPAEEPEETVLALSDGVGDAVADVGAVVAGGDLSRAQCLVLDCCVIGRAPAPVRRRGARPGDLLYLTGSLGGPRAALAYWADGTPPPGLRERFVRPQPRFEAARYLAANRARAMIDVSDGLAADLGHLLAASGVGASVEVDRVPLFAGVREAAARIGEAPWRLAAASGEECELVAALPVELDDATLAAAPILVTAIGVCEAEPGLRATEGGRPVELPAGHDHFAP